VKVIGQVRESRPLTGSLSTWAQSLLSRYGDSQADARTISNEPFIRYNNPRLLVSDEFGNIDMVSLSDSTSVRERLLTRYIIDDERGEIEAEALGVHDDATDEVTPELASQIRAVAPTAEFLPEEFLSAAESPYVSWTQSLHAAASDATSSGLVDAVMRTVAPFGPAISAIARATLDHVPTRSTAAIADVSSTAAAQPAIDAECILRQQLDGWSSPWPKMSERESVVACPMHMNNPGIDDLLTSCGELVQAIRADALAAVSSVAST
jgi:hypothetical protein